MTRIERTLRALLALAFAGLLGACGLFDVEEDKTAALERVAKDWSAVIRASQIIPVYPLNQDVQPGDIFLVQTPIDRQQELYKTKGYLPLDYHLQRLDPNDYERFYRGSFGVGGAGKPLPAWWLAQANDWADAPLAGFPTYQFKVSRQGGFDMALPLQAASVGLSLIGGSQAQGTVSLRRAQTYGIDIIPLALQVQRWASDPEVSKLLTAFGATQQCTAPKSGGCNYLRVISRVFLVREVDVSVSSERRNEGSITAKLVDAPGALLTQLPSVPTRVPGVRAPALPAAPVKPGTTPKTLPVPALQLPAGTALPQGVGGYPAAVQSLNRAIQPLAGVAGNVVGGALDTTGAAPSAGVTVSSFSDRSVSMQETFAHPIVIGYLGFDLAILDKGRLSPPMPTLLVVRGDEFTPATGDWALSAGTIEYKDALIALRENCSGAAAARVLNEAAACLDEPRRRSWLAATKTVDLKSKAAPQALDRTFQRAVREQENASCANPATCTLKSCASRKIAGSTAGLSCYPLATAR